jgi:hypothetical protein
VSNTNDDGAGSLRDAIHRALEFADADTINITARGTISLPSALPYLARFLEGGADITINGPGMNNLTIERDANAVTEFRIFHVGANSTFSARDLTIANGRIPSGGAGIKTNGGWVTLTNVKITGCQTSGGGGGILVDGGARLRLSGVIVTGNKADGAGGGIGMASSTLNSSPMKPRTVIDQNSEITNNTSFYGQGGGIYIDTPGIGRTDVIRITDTKINGNTAKLEGGGLYLATGRTAGEVDVLITTSEINGNRSLEKNGGAVFTGAKLTIDRSKINDNTGQLAAGYAVAVGPSVEDIPLTLRSCEVNTNHHRPVLNGVIQPPDPNSSAVSTGTKTVRFVSCLVRGNDGHGVAGAVNSGGGNIVDNSATTSTGWFPWPIDQVT